METLLQTYAKERTFTTLFRKNFLVETILKYFTKYFVSCQTNAAI